MLRRTALMVAITAGALTATAAPAVVASAYAAPAPPFGRIAHATQNTFTHRLHVTGWAYDPARPARSIVVRLYADGHFLGASRTESASLLADRTRHISGRHGFSLTFTYPRTAHTITLKSVGASTSGPLGTLDTHPSSHSQPSAGARIVSVAKRYVGRARYTEGGASPKTGFDCSGYTKYAYAQAHVATLPHNAQAQRQMSRMHRVSAQRAVPGDLVFYLSGGSAFHVAVYAGHHRQYAAATVRDGIRYQAIWSSNVVYGHYR